MGDRSAGAWARAHLVNPVVRVLLRSRAHGLLSGSMLLLDYGGRRSGRRYVLPVMYTAVGVDLVVVAGQHESKTWWRGFDATPTEVSVCLAGQLRGASASRLAPGTPEEGEARLAYQARFPRAPVEPGAPVLALTPAGARPRLDQQA